MRSRTLNAVVGAVASVCVIAGALWWFYPYLDDARRDWMMRWPPTAVEARAIVGCEDPGWGGLTKALEQDLDDDCPVGWFPSAAAEHLERRAERRLRRLHGVAGDPARPLRSRLRAALTLALVGQPVPPDLAILTREPSVSALRARLVDELHAREWPTGWVDPELALALELRATEQGPGRESALRSALADAATRSDAGAALVRGEIAAELLEWLEIDPDALRAALDRHAHGRPLGHLPPSIALAVHEGDIAACAVVDSAACALWLLRAVPLVEDQAAIDAAGVLRWSWPPIAVLDEGRPGLSDARASSFQRYVAYVAAEHPSRRAERLAALVAARSGAGLPARDIGVDPLSVMRGHAGEPWVVALTASVLGEAADVPVEVGFEGGRVALRVGVARWWLDGCGRSALAMPEAAWPEPLPIQFVAAQATLSMAEAAPPGDPVGARLRVLASRLDPVGAAAPEPAGDPAGWAVGDEAAAHWPTVSDVAGSSRQAVAAWRASTAPAARCDHAASPDP